MSRSLKRIEWEDIGLKFHLLRPTLMSIGSYYCGYVTFPKRPLLEDGYHGIAEYVEVHGGLTFSQQNKDGSFTYGFDCAHLYDDANPNLQNENWLKMECWRMAVNIQVAAEFELKFLTVVDQENVLERYKQAALERRVKLAVEMRCKETE